MCFNFLAFRYCLYCWATLTSKICRNFLRQRVFCWFIVWFLLETSNNIASIIRLGYNFREWIVTIFLKYIGFLFTHYVSVCILPAYFLMVLKILGYKIEFELYTTWSCNRRILQYFICYASLGMAFYFNINHLWFTNYILNQKVLADINTCPLNVERIDMQVRLYLYQMQFCLIPNVVHSFSTLSFHQPKIGNHFSLKRIQLLKLLDRNPDPGNR